MAREPRRRRKTALAALALLGAFTGIIASSTPADAGILDKAKDGGCLDLSGGKLKGLVICLPD